jgi:hypothetical protein
VRSALAWVAYMLGLVLGLDVLVSGLVAEGIWDALGGIAFAVGVWWIATGIGTRLGETPENFFASIGAVLGLGDNPQAPTFSSERKGRSDAGSPDPSGS